jgi:hypothetical protein
MMVSAKVSKNLIAFYNDYPDSEINNDFGTRWSTYAAAPVSDDLRNTLYVNLRRAVAGKTPVQVVEEMLNWVQTAFVYEYDNKVWGKDRAFSPEESLYYPFSDCEDRSILLSRIIRDLLHLDVVLIYYLGHLATAIHFDTDVAGDYVMVGNKKYVIADPTYIGAPLGKTMPNMDNAKAKVILLNRG